MKQIMQFRAVLTVLLMVAMTTSIGLAQDQDLRAKFQEAFQTSQNGDYAKAVELFREIEEADDSIPVLAFHLGYNLHAAGKLHWHRPVHRFRGR